MEGSEKERLVFWLGTVYERNTLRQLDNLSIRFIVRPAFALLNYSKRSEFSKRGTANLQWAGGGGRGARFAR
jgi:hypothetical protein